MTVRVRVTNDGPPQDWNPLGAEEVAAALGRAANIGCELLAEADGAALTEGAGVLDGAGAAAEELAPLDPAPELEPEP